MAFEAETKKYKCAGCGEEHQWYKMWESPWFGNWKEDDAPMRVLAAGQTAASSAELAKINNEKPNMICDRICPNCELARRNEVVEMVQTQNDNNIEVKLPPPNLSHIKTVADFSSLLTEKEREAGTIWNSMEQVLVDIKRVAKGKAWRTTGMALHEARAKVQKMEGSSEMSLKEKRRYLMSTAKEIAEGLCKVIKDGRMFSAFLNAGHRFKIGARVSDELMQLYEDYCENPNGEKGGETLRELEAKEEELYEGLAYQCAGGDTSILKALDYHNDIAEGLLIFDFCQAKIGVQTYCNQYMPSTYFDRPDPEKWTFYCRCNWKQVAEHQPEIIDHFVKNGYGDDPLKWPGQGMGCGAKFAPWKRGPSKIVQLLLDGKQEWIEFPAERLPKELDDEIKKVLYHWHNASKRITAEEIMDCVPLVFPKIGGLDPIKYPGISKFDREDWFKAGKPYLSQSGWIALCQIIARKDLINLQCVFDLADEMSRL